MTSPTSQGRQGRHVIPGIPEVIPDVLLVVPDLPDVIPVLPDVLPIIPDLPNVHPILLDVLPDKLKSLPQCSCLSQHLRVSSPTSPNVFPNISGKTGKTCLPQHLRGRWERHVFPKMLGKMGKTCQGPQGRASQRLNFMSTQLCIKPTGFLVRKLKANFKSQRRYCKQVSLRELSSLVGQ